MQNRAIRSGSKKFPAYGWWGVAIMMLSWFLNWSMTGVRTHLLFFPLWLGFILLTDALVFFRKGDSLITRSEKQFILLFLISIPLWWFFELVNLLAQNWIYRGRELFTDLEFALYASFSFSTVIPAMFEAAELAGSFSWIQKMKGGPRIPATKHTMMVFQIIGLITLTLEFLWPQTFYPLIWITVYLLVEPINFYMKNPNLFLHTDKRDWRPVLALWTGGLICGFFWEMWNYYSFPKWQYDLPGLNVGHIFEMPALGYLGFLAFGLEVYTLYHLIKGIFGRKEEYVKLIPE